jgi:hypothetical protein
MLLVQDWFNPIEDSINKTIDYIEMNYWRQKKNTKLLEKNKELDEETIKIKKELAKLREKNEELWSIASTKIENMTTEEYDLFINNTNNGKNKLVKRFDFLKWCFHS